MSSLPPHPVEEVRQLMALSRAESVTFSGTIESQLGTAWQVGGLSLTVPDALPGAAQISVGDIVSVNARTTLEGTLVAESIRLIEAGTEPPPTPVQAPDATTTPTPSHTAEPAETDAVTTTPEPPVTPTPMPAVTLCIPAAPEGWISYQVQAGDTLSNLANLTNTSSDQLLQVNCLTDPRLIVSGETIFLPFTPPEATSSFAGDDTGRPGVTINPDGDEDDHGDESGEHQQEPEHEDD
jgi:hypothetical protein